MKFSSAQSKIKPGLAIQRKGWNAAGQFVFDATLSLSLTEARKQGLPGAVKLEPTYVIFTAQGKLQPGWVPSQSDLRADDWVVVKIKDQFTPGK